MAIPVNRLDLILSRYEGTRFQVLDQALRGLARHSSEAEVLLAELAFEVHRDRLWRQAKDPNGRPYLTSIPYLCAVTGYAKVNAYYCVLVGRLLHSVPVGARQGLRDALALLNAGQRRMAAVLVLRQRVPLDTALARAKYMDSQAVTEALRRVARSERALAVRGLTAAGVAPSLAEEAYAAGCQALGTQSAKEVLTEALRLALEAWRART